MKDKIYSKKDLFEGFLYSLFLLPLTGTGIPAYIVALIYLFIKINVIKFKIQDLILLGIILTWFVYKSQQTDLFASLVLLRYYFGFYIFYIFFNNINIQFKIDKLLTIICIIVIAEAILINTIISPEWLPNYPKGGSGELLFETKILGFYQRPYSIGTNSTITSTLIMVLMFYIFATSKNIKYENSNLLYWLGIFTVIILASGTGYMLLLLFYIIKVGPFKNLVSAIISFTILMIVYVLIFVVDIGSFNGLEKISATYLEFLYNLKIFQIERVIADLYSVDFQIIIGKAFESSRELIIWSDFAWCDLFLCTGYIGIGVTILIYLLKTNKYNFIPILIFSIGAIHYGACYSLPGQLLLGYFFSTKFKNQISEQLKIKKVTQLND